MDTSKSINYLQQMASDFVQSLPVSAKLATAEKVNVAFQAIVADLNRLAKYDEEKKNSSPSEQETK